MTARARRPASSHRPSRQLDPIADVTELMKGYANKGVFRGLDVKTLGRGVADFVVTWHSGLTFHVIIDVKKATLRVPVLLPDVPTDVPIAHDLRVFVQSKHDPELLPHRRIDPAKAQARARKLHAHLSLTMDVRKGAFVYAAERLVLLMHETFMSFLADGRFFEYRIARLGLDPDSI